MAYFYHTASKNTFRAYIYLRTMDLLFKSPAFHFNSRNPVKLMDSVKGLLVLHTILNGDVKGYFKYFHEQKHFHEHKYQKCGWAQAIKDANASYKKEIIVEKLEPRNEHSPSPTPYEEVSDEDEIKKLYERLSIQETEAICVIWTWK